LLAAVLLPCLYLPTLRTRFDFIDDGNLVYPAPPMSAAQRLHRVWERIQANYEHLGPFRPVLWAQWETEADLLDANRLAWRAARHDPSAWIGAAVLAGVALAALLAPLLLAESRQPHAGRRRDAGGAVLASTAGDRATNIAGRLANTFERYPLLIGAAGLAAAAVAASLLLMPLVRFISPTDPRWLSTLRAIEEDLVDDSLVYRYNVEQAADGLRGREGTFSMCSFWYVECLARGGDFEKARLFFEKMLGYANHLGLYGEQLGRRGEHLGNFPQALTHLALISAAYALNRRFETAGRGHRPDPVSYTHLTLPTNREV